MKFYVLLLPIALLLVACGNSNSEETANGTSTEINDDDLKRTAATVELNNSAVVSGLGKKKFDAYIKGIQKDRELKANYLSGDLNGDGKLDLIVDYCTIPTEGDLEVEGGGNALAGMRCMDEGFVIYLNTGTDLVRKMDAEKPVNGTEMYMDALSINDGFVLCNVKVLGEEDGRFPTVDKRLRFKFNGDALVRVVEIDGPSQD